MAGTDGAGRQLSSWAGSLAERVRERPYPLLGLSLMVGYVAGGGLFSPVTRPLARAALGVLLVPGVRERLRSVTDEFRVPQASGAA
jgi:hypothetical protein